MKTHGELTRSERIPLRVTAREKELIQEAAHLRHTNVSVFILRTSLAQAERELADQREFRLSPSRWAAFQKALDRPPTSNDRLRRLLKTNAPWE
ncbi:MAG: DUF1778 domain-containing protein [Elusimicrobia bacterium]|nr:DUF1778 domain-containing protein [Elusimicrobiota bacterium]